MWLSNLQKRDAMSYLSSRACWKRIEQFRIDVQAFAESIGGCSGATQDEWKPKGFDWEDPTGVGGVDLYIGTKAFIKAGKPSPTELAHTLIDTEKKFKEGLAKIAGVKDVGRVHMWDYEEWGEELSFYVALEINPEHFLDKQ